MQSKPARAAPEARRYLAVYLPTWPADRLLRRIARRVARGDFLFLAETKNNQRLVAACCGASLRAGARRGMSVAHATALLPPGARLVLRDHAPVEDAAALLALARWAVRFSPTAAPDYPDGLMLDVTGCQRLYGSDENLAALVAGSLRALGLEARVGIAPTIGAAWAVARFATQEQRIAKTQRRQRQSKELVGGPASSRAESRSELTLRPVARNFAAVSMPVELKSGGQRLEASATGAGANSSSTFAVSLRLCDSSSFRIVSEDEWPELFGRFPIAALRIEEKIVDELAEVGIDHVGQLLEIPREEIAARFDANLLLRIDQATGEAMEAMHPVRHEEPLQVSLRFAGPTTQFEAIEQAVQKLVEMLCARLLKREAGARKLVLEIERLDEELYPEWAQETLTLSRPSRNAKHIWNLLCPRIERLHLGEGIEELVICARRTAPLPHEQEHFDGSSDESEEATSGRLKEAAGQLVDLLESRLGPPAVLAARVVETHIPEGAFRMVPASEGGLAKLQGSSVPSSKQAPGSKPQVPNGHSMRLCGSFEDDLKVADSQHLTNPSNEVRNLELGTCLKLGRLELGASQAIGTTTLEPISTSIPSPGDRPTVLFDEPQPAAVTLLQPEGPIIGLHWHRLHRILRAIGPERIGRRWWQFALSRRQPARDYYRLQDEEGLWLWVYRSRFSRKWFVHGVWG